MKTAFRAVATVAVLAVSASVSGFVAAAPAHADPTWCVGDTTITSTHSNLLVSTEYGSDHRLRARAAQAGEWESYWFCPDPDTDTFGIQLSNNQWATAEISYPAPDTGLLRGRTTSWGAWERFRCYRLGGNDVAFLSLANNRFVTAENGSTGTRFGNLRARATSVGAWETFRVDSTVVSMCDV